MCVPQRLEKAVQFNGVASAPSTHVHLVRDVAPRKTMLRIVFKLPAEVAFAAAPATQAGTDGGASSGAATGGQNGSTASGAGAGAGATATTRPRQVGAGERQDDSQPRAAKRPRVGASTAAT